MKIAVLGTRGIPRVQGGVETYCENLYPLLVKKGCEVLVYGRASYVKSTRPYRFQGVTVIPLSAPRNKYFEAFIHTFKALIAARRFKPDIVHFHAIGPSFFAPLARLLGMKVVMTHQGPDYMRKKWGRFTKAFLRFSEYCGVRWSEHVVVVDGHIIPLIRHIREAGISVIPNGVAAAVPKPSDGLLSRYGLRDRKYILAVGRIVPEKGFLDLIEAFKKMRFNGNEAAPELSSWKLVIVGDADHADPYSEQLKRRARSENNVVLTGFLTSGDLREAYTNAGMFVLPSYHEGLPLALLEALSYGLPCVVSNIPAHQSLALRQQCFFNPGDINALVRSLQRGIRSPMTEEERARQIAYIREHFNWEDIAQKMLEVYKKVLKSEK